MSAQPTRAKLQTWSVSLTEPIWLPRSCLFSLILKVNLTAFAKRTQAARYQPDYNDNHAIMIIMYTMLGTSPCPQASPSSKESCVWQVGPNWHPKGIKRVTRWRPERLNWLQMVPKAPAKGFLGPLGANLGHSGLIQMDFGLPGLDNFCLQTPSHRGSHKHFLWLPLGWLFFEP